MSHPSSAIVLAATLAAFGCQSQQQVVDSMQAEAAHTAQRRAAFEMNCPAATAQVLSQEMIQSPIMNPRFAPPQRAEYTVGVAGCGGLWPASDVSRDLRAGRHRLLRGGKPKRYSSIATMKGEN
jgi:hypothetical protein